MISRILVLAAALSALGAPALAAALSPLRAPPGAPAADADRRVGVLFRIGLEYGGEDLLKDFGASEKLKAGEFLDLAGGLLIRPPLPLALEVTGGWKMKEVSSDGLNIKFTRYPVDAVASFVFDTAQVQHRLGGGVTVHLSPKLSCDGSEFCPAPIKFKNAWGGIAQYVLSLPIHNSGVELGIRYTWIKYRVKDEWDGPPKVDGSCFGVFFGGWI